MNEGDKDLRHWNQAERDKVRAAVQDVALTMMEDCKTLTVRDVLFETYLSCVWLSADIDLTTMSDFLEYVSDLNGRYIKQMHENIKLTQNNQTSRD